MFHYTEFSILSTWNFFDTLLERVKKPWMRVPAKICARTQNRHSGTLLAGIQLFSTLDPGQKHAGVTFAGTFLTPS